ncbi:hypothetical protein [Pseudalkalibacillus caeni]|uniref:hypothetical protein n=1 Tax=Exobacillus caeni TaxID=2574798 RepID=UPI00148561ED|nr:hypothetical protein [Pseudalkalibacillus caeni]
MKRKRHYVEDQLLKEAAGIREYKKMDVLKFSRKPGRSIGNKHPRKEITKTGTLLNPQY